MEIPIQRLLQRSIKPHIHLAFFSDILSFGWSASPSLHYFFHNERITSIVAVNRPCIINFKNHGVSKKLKGLCLLYKEGGVGFHFYLYQDKKHAEYF